MITISYLTANLIGIVIAALLFSLAITTFQLYKFKYLTRRAGRWMVIGHKVLPKDVIEYITKAEKEHEERSLRRKYG